MSNLDRLRETVELLQQTYDRSRDEMAKNYSHPELVITTEGRYILLDALVALVQARTAVAQAEAPQLAVKEAMVIQSGDMLLLRVDGNLSRSELDEYSDVIAAPLKDRLGLKDVVLLGGIDDWAVKR